MRAAVPAADPRPSCKEGMLSSRETYFLLEAFSGGRRTSSSMDSARTACRATRSCLLAMSQTRMRTPSLFAPASIRGLASAKSQNRYGLRALNPSEVGIRYLNSMSH